MKTIKKILIANRGEIAIRVMRTAREMGIKTVAVFSEADKDALFTTIADEAIGIGGNAASESYLDQNKIIEAARRTEADAIHPGYGFLSENASFAQRCADEGIIFIGPSADVISKLGSKIKAKEIAQKAGVPCVPGYNGKEQSAARLKYEAEEIGFPVLIKASAGGGGKGMRIVNSADELEAAFDAAKREAEKSFGDGSLLLEKYFPKAKHIEFQIFGDEHGNHLNLFDRECSMQRRYQKVIEESPSPSLDEDLRTRMGEAALAIAKAVDYTNAGTVEFILDEQKNFYFLEVNTRLQVEHPVTEMVVGVDLVQMQIAAAMGVALAVEQEMLMQRGHSIECRICAEDPENNFFPSTGKILYAEAPFSFFTRIDSGVESESEVSMFYDSMLAKLIVYAETRSMAIQKMELALEGFPILGITTNIDFLKELIQHPNFEDGTFDTKLIERDFSSYKKLVAQNQLHETAIVAMLSEWVLRKNNGEVAHSLNGWRNIFYQPQIFEVEFGTGNVKLEYRYKQDGKFEVKAGGETYAVEFFSADGNIFVIEIDNHRSRFFVAKNETEYFIQHPSAGTFRLKQVPRFAEPGNADAKGGYIAPMPGEIVKVLVKVGDKIQSGKGLLVMSSMKMETTIEAHSDGEVEEIFVGEKSFVEAGTVLVKMKAE